ncbi:putative transporter C11D3.18C [Mycena sanguinolenta]|uniref:Putative transporter C11D3.18C n=1 Tax=Mycena sanguinolenta TaxID=230812 RepID=A0A8H7DMJ2_9AGAR|nr:putative transporter C11D3.18C [Mycena sanguinolenta]
MEKSSSSSEEKPDGVDLVDQIDSVEGSEAPAFEKDTMRHVDWRVLPLMSALYAIYLSWTAPISRARTAGMGTDLGLTIGNRYSVVACLYFVPYTLMYALSSGLQSSAVSTYLFSSQLPGNVFLRFFGVRLWLTICVLGHVYASEIHNLDCLTCCSWGVTQLGMGWVKTWGQLAACRTLLGLFEGGFFPALVFVITTWYKRHEVQTRIASFYLLSVIIGGFSGILAYGITFMKNKGGLASWRWIFILEGIATIVLAILNHLFIADFPEKNTFLTPEQTKLVLHRIEVDRGDAVPDEITMQKVLHHMADWTLWAYALMFMSSAMPVNAIAFFGPTILSSMGFNLKDSLLLTTPPYVSIFAAFTCFIFAWMSDRAKIRAPFIAFHAVLMFVGVSVTGYTEHNGPRYFGLFLVTAGASTAIPAILAYVGANNIVSQSRRAVQTAVVISAGGVGGIFATLVFRQQDFPRYMPGVWAIMALQGSTLLLLMLTSWHFVRQNRLSKEGKLTAPLEGQPGFFYTL